MLHLGDHSKGRRDPQRAMNIACGVVIGIVVVAMIVATIVYFCVNKKDTTSGVGSSAPGVDMAAPKIYQPAQHMVQMAKHSGSAIPTNPSAIPQHGMPQLGPEREGIIFPKLSKDDEAELRASYQLDLVKNYAKGKMNAVLKDPKYNMVYDLPPLHKVGSAYISARPKEDETLFQAQTRQAKMHPPQYNQTEDMAMLLDHNIVPYLS